MTLQLIEPGEIQITGALPLSCHLTQCYYLGYASRQKKHQRSGLEGRITLRR
jgi:hypothetical protein